MKHLSHAAALLSAVVLGAGCGDQPTSPSVSVLPSFSNGSSGSSGCSQRDVGPLGRRLSLHGRRGAGAPEGLRRR